MKQAKELVESLKKILGNDAQVFPALVKSVDTTKCTCEVEFNEMEFGDVRLQATIKENAIGFKLFPKVGTVVIVQRLGNNGEMFVVMYSEIDEILLQTDNTELQIKEGFRIKKGEETLKKILNDLIAAIKSITVPTNVGPSGVPINGLTFEEINTRINNILK